MRSLLRLPWYSYPFILYGLWIGFSKGSLPAIDLPTVVLPSMPSFVTLVDLIFIVLFLIMGYLLIDTIMLVICDHSPFNTFIDWIDRKKNPNLAKMTPARKVKDSSRNIPPPEVIADASKKIRKNVFGIKDTPATWGEFDNKPIMVGERWRLLDVDLNTLGLADIDTYLNTLYAYGNAIKAKDIPDYNEWTNHLRKKIQRATHKLEELDRDLLRGWN